MSRRRHPRIRAGAVCRVALAAVLVLALGVPSTASADSIADLQRQRTRLSADLRKANDAFDRALAKLEDSSDHIAAIKKKVKVAQAKLDKAQGNLQARCRFIYKTGNTDFVSVILDATSYEDLFTRMDFVRSIVDHDANEIREVRRLRKELDTQLAALKRANATLKINERQLRKRRRTLEAQLTAKRAEYERLKKFALAAARVRNVGYLPPGPNGMVFPVDGPCSYSDTWGAPRGGGTRSHKGTDIMAARGTPCVAVLSGYVNSKDGGLGGKVTWLTADNGWRFYYAHLSRWEVRSGRVKAGQLIGYVGSTGNAAGGAPHLHFEIHPNGGSAVDPYPYLRQMER